MTLEEYINGLKEIAKEYGPHIPVIHKSKNYELKDSLVDVYIYEKYEVVDVKKKKALFIDDFDHTTYTQDIYEECSSVDKNAIKAVKL